ncbi:MAG TPA: FMN reductase [Humibacter sp.]|nr:FMN reductase [Humibacter sp.]
MSDSFSKRITVVSAGLSQPSSTRLLADRLAEASRAFLVEEGEGVEVTTIELRDHAAAIANNLVTGFPSPALAEAIDAVSSADGLIVVTPIFNASYNGLFKSFFDVLDSDALAGTPVLLAATGGSARHSLALEHALRPLFSYLHARTVPTAVYAASEDWGSAGERDGDLMLRIGRAAHEFAELVARYSSPRASGDTVEPRLTAATGELFVVPFEQQLANLRGRG